MLNYSFLTEIVVQQSIFFKPKTLTNFIAFISLSITWNIATRTREWSTTQCVRQERMVNNSMGE